MQSFFLAYYSLFLSVAIVTLINSDCRPCPDGLHPGAPIAADGFYFSIGDRQML
jgi:hypothetical protein